MKSRNVHAQSLETSAAISAFFFPKYIGPLDVLAALSAADIHAVLTGTHALGGWMKEPRAVRETTVLVAARSHRKALWTLLAAYPHLRPEAHETGTTLTDTDPKGVVIDVLRAVRPLLRKTLVQTHTVKMGRRSYLIPTLETALALVFGQMIDLEWSDADKYLYAHDFLLVIKTHPDLDLKALAACGELLYKGGGALIVDVVNRVRAGEKLTSMEEL